MVNLKKEYPHRKTISLIKPENEINRHSNTPNIKCQLLSSEYEPRIKHPIYTQEQYCELNKQRLKYKDPEKYDAPPDPDSQDINKSAIPPVYQNHYNMVNKPHPDTDALMEMARIHNNQSERNTKTDAEKSQLALPVSIVLVIIAAIIFMRIVQFILPVFPLIVLPSLILLIGYVQTLMK